MIGYTYDGENHCIACTCLWAKRLSLTNGGNGTVRITNEFTDKESLIEYHISYESNQPYGRIQGYIRPSWINPLFSKGQDLTCGDCHGVIDILVPA